MTSFNLYKINIGLLVRQCLFSHPLPPLLLSVSHPCREWYHVSAVLLLPSLSQRVLSSLYDLSEVTFDLPLDGVELDDHWPSFTL